MVKSKSNHKVLPFLLYPVFFTVRLYKFVKCLYCDVWLLKGREISSGENIMIAYSGYRAQKAYVVRIIFGGVCEETYFGKRWPWQLRKAFDKYKNDIALSVCEMPTIFSSLIWGKEYLCVPDWIGGDMDFSLVDFSKKSLKSDVKNVRKSGFTFEITDDASTIREVYNDMCASTEEQYGEENLDVSYEQLVKDSERVDVLIVKKLIDSERMGGALLSYEKNGVRCIFVGVKMQNDDFIKTTVMQALDYFSFCYLKGKGYKKMSLGGSRAFFHDGVFEYKRKWGFRVNGFANRMMLIKPNYENSAVKSFLAHNPCMVVKGKKIIGKIYVDKHVMLSDQEKKLLCRYRVPGINKIVAYHFEGTHYAEWDMTDFSSDDRKIKHGN